MALIPPIAYGTDILDPEYPVYPIPFKYPDLLFLPFRGLGTPLFRDIDLFGALLNRD